MTREEFKNYISNGWPAASFDETGEWLAVEVPEADWKNLARQLRSTQNMNYLFCLTCVDWKTHLTMVYHLTSTGHRQSLVC